MDNDIINECMGTFILLSRWCFLVLRLVHVHEINLFFNKSNLIFLINQLTHHMHFTRNDYTSYMDYMGLAVCCPKRLLNSLTHYLTYSLTHLPKSYHLPKSSHLTHLNHLTCSLTYSTHTSHHLLTHLLYLPTPLTPHSPNSHHLLAHSLTYSILLFHSHLTYSLTFSTHSPTPLTHSHPTSLTYLTHLPHSLTYSTHRPHLPHSPTPLRPHLLHSPTPLTDLTSLTYLIRSPTPLTFTMFALRVTQWQ